MALDQMGKKAATASEAPDPTHVRRIRKRASPPWGTYFLDQCRFFSYSTWQGVAGFSGIDTAACGRELRRALLALLLPPIAAVATTALLSHDRSYGWLSLLSSPVSSSSSSSFFIDSATGNTVLDSSFSSTTGSLVRAGSQSGTRGSIWWMWGRLCYATWALWWMKQGTPGVRRWASQVWRYRTMRSPAYVDAWENLAHRLEQGRAYRTRRYDVYLPQDISFTPKCETPVPDAPDPHRPTRFILFIPGTAVEHVAYVGPSGLLSDVGYVVVVLSAEPLRLPNAYDPQALPWIRQVQRTVEHRHGQASSSSSTTWILLGHSLGALTATHWAEPLQIKHLVLWAVGPFVQHIKDLSSKSAAQLSLLILQGSQDVVLATFGTTEQVRQQFGARFPPQTERLEVTDGTHMGFADYHSCWKPEVSDLPRQEQQQQAVQATLDFLARHGA